jgi:hypothetical protein
LSVVTKSIDLKEEKRNVEINERVVENLLKIVVWFGAIRRTIQ